MAERKTKWTEKEQEKKVTRRTLSAKTKTEKKITSKKKENISSPTKTTHFLQKKENKISFWILFLFFFSLAFLLFALYKVFVFWKWYSTLTNHKDSGESAVFSIKNMSTSNKIVEGKVMDNEVNNISNNEFLSNDEDDAITNDIRLIQNFYSHLMNNEITEMNQLVDTPLRTSSTWRSHRSSKNIWIFTNHIINENISLDNISLIPWSDNKEKRTRKYWYTLWYTIDSNETFNEDWEVTLLDRNWKTLISEIMCKTDWCSHSPFFWPQNYNLK